MAPTPSATTTPSKSPSSSRPQPCDLYPHGCAAPRTTATAITIAVLTALTPTVTCLIGIILSRQDVRDLRTERNNLRTDVRAEMITFRYQIHSDLLRIHERV